MSERQSAPLPQEEEERSNDELRLPPPPSESGLIIPRPHYEGFTFRQLHAPEENENKGEERSHYGGLWRTGSLLGRDYQVVVVQPEKDRQASNFDSKNPSEILIYVPGVNSSEKGFLRDARHWANMYGREMVVIVNDIDESSVKDYFNATLGAVSSRTVSSLEPDSLRLLNEELEHHIKDGLDVRIVPYSQGGSISNSAILDQLKKTNPDKWKELLDRIAIESFGSDLDNWPWIDRLKTEGMNVREYMHSGDMVPDLTHAGSTAKVGVKKGYSFLRYATEDAWKGAKAWFEDKSYTPDKTKRIPFDSYKGKEIIMPFENDSAHDAEMYSKHMHTFLILAHTSGDGKLNGSSLGREVLRTIEEGVYSDHVHDNVIAVMLRKQNVDFARELLAVAEDGKIGNYRIPSYSDLLALARPQ